MVEVRDQGGRFVNGHPGNPNAKGRPKKAREERYYEIAMSTVTYDDWKAIVKKAAQQAKKGDNMARKWLGDYLVGPPAQRHELSGPDGGPIETTDARSRLLASIEREMEAPEAAAEEAAS